MGLVVGVGGEGIDEAIVQVDPIDGIVEVGGGGMEREVKVPVEVTEGPNCRRMLWGVSLTAARLMVPVSEMALPL